MNATAEHSSLTGSSIKLVSVPDGLGPEDDRNDLAKLCLAMLSTIPSMLVKLIETINGLDGGINRITCIVADAYMAWALEVANKLGIKGALLCPSSAAVFALKDNIPKLIHDGILNSDGFPIIKGKFKLFPNMPMIDTADIPWGCICDRSSQKITYDYHSPRSVIYVAFGSFTIFDSNQFREPAFGLQLTNRPFLWVVRSDTNSSNTENTYPDGFQENHGKIVEWAPQQKVLSHPAIACFITHCGWNSTIEGGIGFDLDKKGLVLREEVKKKVDQLLGDENFRERSMKLKEMTTNNIADGGSFSQIWLQDHIGEHAQSSATTDPRPRVPVGRPDSLIGSQINLVTLPHGLGPEDSINELMKELVSISMSMGSALEVGQELGTEAATCECIQYCSAQKILLLKCAGQAGLGFDKDESGVISMEEIKKVEQLLGDEDIRQGL
ncbi:hypothetical protein L6164_006730 [Bauhinia variegata]|uniref:Uncharacterized protein n=1 Tax=Bauhinia variegata TaxID=167791 RepID=A0ACB9PUS9_BAUVA|nr:hypothetical protein L6164_006730 [Bauhinia variegata]